MQSGGHQNQAISRYKESMTFKGVEPPLRMGWVLLLYIQSLKLHSDFPSYTQVSKGGLGEQTVSLRKPAVANSFGCLKI